MMAKAITLYQQGNFKKSAKLLHKINKLASNQGYLSLLLEAACLAKQCNYSKAKKLAEKSLTQPHNASERKQADELIANINLAIARDKSIPVNRLRQGELTQVITSDDDSATAITQRLLELIESMSGSFDCDIKFVIANGELSIKSKSLTDQTHLSMPMQCIPLLTDYHLSITDPLRLVATPKDKLINKHAVPIMELLVSLYNASGKLRAWQRHFIFLGLANHSQAIVSLLDFRPVRSKVKRYKQHYDQQNWSALLLESFIGSREFSFEQQHFIATNIRLKQDTEPGLLAVVDFLNHHMDSPGYQINAQAGRLNIIGSADKANGELFVQYGRFDPLQTLLIYGFVDQKSSILYSGKLEIDLLAGNTLCVVSFSGGLSRKSPLPNDFEHLKNIIPPGIKRDSDKIIVSDLLIPQCSDNDQLSQVIEFVLQQTDNANVYSNDLILQREIAYVKKQLIALNYQYWLSFEQQHLPVILADPSVDSLLKNNLTQLCDFCFEHLSAYT
jgi:hypothetical protein